MFTITSSTSSLSEQGDDWTTDVYVLPLTYSSSFLENGEKIEFGVAAMLSHSLETLRNIPIQFVGQVRQSYETSYFQINKPLFAICSLYE